MMSLEESAVEEVLLWGRTGEPVELGVNLADGSDLPAVDISVDREAGADLDVEVDVDLEAIVAQMLNSDVSIDVDLDLGSDLDGETGNSCPSFLLP
jgi:hypothetical protein